MITKQFRLSAMLCAALSLCSDVILRATELSTNAKADAEFESLHAIAIKCFSVSGGITGDRGQNEQRDLLAKIAQLGIEYYDAHPTDARKWTALRIADKADFTYEQRARFYSKAGALRESGFARGRRPYDYESESYFGGLCAFRISQTRSETLSVGNVPAEVYLDLAARQISRIARGSYPNSDDISLAAYFTERQRNLVSSILTSYANQVLTLLEGMEHRWQKGATETTDLISGKVHPVDGEEYAECVRIAARILVRLDRFDDARVLINRVANGPMPIAAKLVSDEKNRFNLVESMIERRRTAVKTDQEGMKLPPDGPYIKLLPNGKMTALYAVPGTVDFLKKEQHVQPGDSVTIGEGAGDLAFSAVVRAPSTSPDAAEFLAAEGRPLFVMADTHGQYDVCITLLKKQGIIDNSLRWAFGRGLLVITGDVFDRGAQQTEILWLIYKLEAEALSAGGRVHFILGNHETMALRGNLGYLNARYHRVATDLGAKGYDELFGPDTLLGHWLRTKPAVVRIGRTLFMHGGLSVGPVNAKLSIAEINQTVRDWLGIVNDPLTARQALVTGRDGPLWYRGYFSKGEAIPGEIAQVKQFYDVDRIAVGHTIVPAVKALWNGDIIAVQVYPTKDATTGIMNMEGAYVDEQGVWFRAKIDGTREMLRDEKGNPLRNTPPQDAAKVATPGKQAA